MNEIVREINAKIFFEALSQAQNYLKCYVLYVNLLEFHFVYTFLKTTDDHWLGILDSFTPTDASMIPFLIINFISKSGGELLSARLI